MKITTVLYAPEIEPQVDFYTGRLGFTLTVSVPHGDKLGFAILQKGDAELMLQSLPSAAADVPQLAPFCQTSKAALFIEVSDFEDILRRLEGLTPCLPERTTFYGMREIGVFDPAGNLVAFACPVK